MNDQGNHLKQAKKSIKDLLQIDLDGKLKELIQRELDEDKQRAFSRSWADRDIIVIESKKSRFENSRQGQYQLCVMTLNHVVNDNIHISIYQMKRDLFAPPEACLATFKIIQEHEKSPKRKYSYNIHLPSKVKEPLVTQGNASYNEHGALEEIALEIYDETTERSAWWEGSTYTSHMMYTISNQFQGPMVTNVWRYTPEIDIADLKTSTEGNVCSLILKEKNKEEIIATYGVQLQTKSFHEYLKEFLDLF